METNTDQLINKTLGVLGGGQLGKMLIESSAPFKLKIKVLDPDKDAPCSKLANEFVQGSLTDFDTVYNFGKTVDLLTIEIENVNTEALEKLEMERVTVYPSSKVIKTIQDKGLQKQFYQQYGIPTPPFELVANKEELLKFEGPFPIVQKLRKAGYDGKGVKVLKSVADLETGFEAPSLLENFMDMEKEIAVIIARTPSGAMKTYPAVEMVFHEGANLVDFLLAPAEIAEETAKVADQIAQTLAEKLQMVGVLAVEMFVTKAGEVLVNEIAPRPHNSGHHTIEGNETSQYEQHLRAIFDLPLGSTATKSPAIMVNLVGESGFEGEAKYQGIEQVQALEGAAIHLYGKAKTKPFRKMGHVTILGKTREELLQKAEFVKQTLKVVA